MPARTAACRRRFRRTEWSAFVSPHRTCTPAPFGLMLRRREAPSRSMRPPSSFETLAALAPQDEGGASGLCASTRSFAAMNERARLLLRFQRVLHRVEGRELDGVELALHLLDLADIDVLDDVAGVRIDRDRT